MPRPSSRHPTELELEILKVLWNQGPSSVRQIQEALSPARELAYTTVVTMLTIMSNKKYVRRNRAGGGYAYEANLKQTDASANMLSDVIDRVFDGSVPAVVQHLLETSDLDAEELKIIRQLVSKRQKEHKS